jgi:hypothetical protein
VLLELPVLLEPLELLAQRVIPARLVRRVTAAQLECKDLWDHRDHKALRVTLELKAHKASRATLVLKDLPVLLALQDLPEPLYQCA